MTTFTLGLGSGRAPEDHALCQQAVDPGVLAARIAFWSFTRTRSEYDLRTRRVTKRCLPLVPPFYYSGPRAPEVKWSR